MPFCNGEEMRGCGSSGGGVGFEKVILRAKSPMSSSWPSDFSIAGNVFCLSDMCTEYCGYDVTVSEESGVGKSGVMMYIKQRKKRGYCRKSYKKRNCQTCKKCNKYVDADR